MKRMHVCCIIVTVCVFSCVWLAGCSSIRRQYPEPITGNPFLEEWKPVDTAMVANAATSEAPATVKLAPASEPVTVPPVAKTAKIGFSAIAGPALPNQMIEFLNLPADNSLQTVLRVLAKVGNVNMAISPKVEGSINFTFKNIPWDQAFAGVLTTAGLSYTWDGEIIRVMTFEDMKRELEIEKVRNERESLRDALDRLEPLTVHVIKVKYMSAKKIAQTVKDMLGTISQAPLPGAPTLSRVMVSLAEENNSLIVHATSKDGGKIAELVSKLDQPKMQVRIDARIVEANSSTARQLGVQWGGSYMSTAGHKIYTAGTGGRPWAANFPATFNSKEVGFALGLMEQDFSGAELLNLQLSALQEDGKAKILSSPSITTLDNEAATIESGQERAYRVASTSGNANNQDVTLQWKKAVLKLEVTPHVIDPQTLRVEITANKDSFDESKQESNGEFPVATKNTKTTVVLKNGQTTVIGGLSEKMNSEADSGIPYLKSIPFFGRLFKGTKDSASLDEILIFVTPTILKEPAVTTLQDSN